MIDKALSFKKTSELPPAQALTGDEVLALVQSASSMRVSLSDIIAAVGTLYRLAGVTSQDDTDILPTDTIVVAIGKLQARLAKTISDTDIGALASAVPLNQFLGQLAFSDRIGAVTVYQHTNNSSPGEVWHEYDTDKRLIKKFHGFDGVIRSIIETYK